MVKLASSAVSQGHVPPALVPHDGLPEQARLGGVDDEPDEVEGTAADGAADVSDVKERRL